MSMSKRILFGDDPADDGIRQKMRGQTAEFLEPFKFKISTRRKNRVGRGPHWDPFWRTCLETAAKELKVEIVQINDQMCVKVQADVALIKARAEELHQARINKYSTVP